MSVICFQTRRTSRAARMALQATLLGGLMAAGTSANALITFEFDYGADNGAGFWETGGVGTSRQNALTTAANSFSTMFATHFSNTATILLKATATNAPASDNLASAGSRLFGGSAGFDVNDLVRTKALGGADTNGAAYDGTVDVNFGQPWQLDINAPVAGGSSGQYDFYSTVYHEFTHALGFSSLINQDGTSVFAPANAWGTFDKYVANAAGTPMIDPTTFAINQVAWDAASVGGTSPAAGLFFNGAFATAANGGNAVGLYSPVIWKDGSSGSHIDTDNPAFAGLMMLHATPTGPGARNYSAVEVGIMRDLGYTAVTAVPEPGTYGLMLAGLGLVGWMARRRKA